MSVLVNCEILASWNFLLFIDFAFHLCHIRLAFSFSLKTSLLKWRPDFDSAADEYNKAGKYFTANSSEFLIIFSQLIQRCASATQKVWATARAVCWSAQTVIAKIVHFSMLRKLSIKQCSSLKTSTTSVRSRTWLRKQATCISSTDRLNPHHLHSTKLRRFWSLTFRKKLFRFIRTLLTFPWYEVLLFSKQCVTNYFSIFLERRWRPYRNWICVESCSHTCET